MPIKVLMPALSPTMTEGKLAKWTIKQGDKIKSGQVIAEIETDKATMEVEAVDDGIVGKILVQGGTENVPVNDVIALLLEEGEDESALKNIDAPKAASAPKAEPKKEEVKAVAPSVPAAAPVNHSSGDRVFASPLAKRIAKESNIDLARVSGTGPKGRIVKEDVEKALKGGGAVASTQGIKSAPLAGAVDPIALANQLGQAHDVIPASGVRQVIANRLLQSKQTIPHFYLTVDCELDALLALRQQVNKDSEKFKLSVNDFIIKACAKSMRDVPEVNTAWAGNSIVQYKDVDVSVAVASDNGLITPIVKKADEKTLTTISSEMKDLASRARDGRLKPNEFQGGGFTISNLGMFGIKEFSAIINPPQSCILAVGAGEQRPVVKNGALAVATVMSVTLSCDHRTVDGAVGAQFLDVFKKYIENPAKILV